MTKIPFSDRLQRFKDAFGFRSVVPIHPSDARAARNINGLYRQLGTNALNEHTFISVVGDTAQTVTCDRSFEGQVIREHYNRE